MQDTKIGRVKIETRSGSYRIRFTYPKGVRHQFIVARVSSEGWASALKTAHIINRDIDLGEFDPTYSRYSSFYKQPEKVIKNYDLQQLWERYKEHNQDRIAITTQKHTWKKCDRLLTSVPKTYLSLNRADDFIKQINIIYAPGTLKVLFRTCINPCINQAIEAELITKNPYSKNKLIQTQKKVIEVFSSKELKFIIEAFYKDSFQPKNSRFNHSHYAAYVEFLALTGARLEEALALTKEDIITKNDKTYIRINKVYSCGVLLPHTKTHIERDFPCNQQLINLLNKIEPKASGLLFSTHKDKYIDGGNFRQRYWKVVVDSLVNEGKVEKYLKPYCLRHSFITRLIEEGVGVGTVASLVGNTPSVIMQHYLGRDRKFLPPEL